MAATFGTAVVGTYDWGFRGTILPTHVGLRIGMRVRNAMTLVDGSGNTLIQNQILPVVGGA